jgi:hypothetical protein
MATNLHATERFSLLLASTGIVVALTVSGNLLTDLGIAYTTEGGTPAEKIHPASYLMIFAGLLRLATDAVGRVASSRAYAKYHALMVYTGGIVFCTVYGLLFSGTGNVIALLDTFLPAGCAAFTLSTMSPKQREWLGMVITLLCTVNAAIAIIESAGQTRLVPAGPDALDPQREFRPAALYDHPLTGSAATVLGLLLSARLAWPSAVVMPCQAILLIGMVCFGERAPLAIGLGLLIIAGIVSSGRRIIQRQPCYRRIAVLVWTGFIAALVIAAVLVDGLSDRLAAHSYWDDSAQVRFSQFRILAWLTPAELIFGCPREDLIALLEPLRLTYRVGVIENFWLVMLTSLGVLGFPIFVMSLWHLLRWLWRAGGAASHLMIIALITTASASNSLGRKSMLLTLLVACVIASDVPGRRRLAAALPLGVRRLPA